MKKISHPPPPHGFKQGKSTMPYIPLFKSNSDFNNSWNLGDGESSRRKLPKRQVDLTIRPKRVPYINPYVNQTKSG
jgi:hypothetical protein